jgi:hypothetical protein
MPPKKKKGRKNAKENKTLPQLANVLEDMTLGYAWIDRYHQLALTSRIRGAGNRGIANFSQFVFGDGESPATGWLKEFYLSVCIKDPKLLQIVMKLLADSNTGHLDRPLLDLCEEGYPAELKDFEEVWDVVDGGNRTCWLQNMEVTRKCWFLIYLVSLFIAEDSGSPYPGKGSPKVAGC